MINNQTFKNGVWPGEVNIFKYTESRGISLRARDNTQRLDAILRQLDDLSWQHLSVVSESRGGQESSSSQKHALIKKPMEGDTDLAPMDWKLHDSEDTTHPSVSCSPEPGQGNKCHVNHLPADLCCQPTEHFKMLEYLIPQDFM